jgi:hypothetical protein
MRAVYFYFGLKVLSTWLCFGFQILTLATVKKAVFWVLTPCTSETAWSLLLGLIFNPEDGSDIFLRNVWLYLNYMASEPRRPCSRLYFFFIVYSYRSQNYYLMKLKKKCYIGAPCFFLSWYMRFCPMGHCCMQLHKSLICVSSLIIAKQAETCCEMKKAHTSIAILYSCVWRNLMC